MWIDRNGISNLYFHNVSSIKKMILSIVLCNFMSIIILNYLVQFLDQIQSLEEAAAKERRTFQEYKYSTKVKKCISLFMI